MSVQFSQKEASEYFRSVLQGISSRAEGKPLTGLAREIHDELAGKVGDTMRASDKSIFLPYREMCRTLFATGSFAAAGALVAGSVSAPVDDLQTPPSVVLQLGAEMITNLSGGTRSHPVETDRTDVDFYHENETVTESDPAIGALSLTPHRCAGATSISGQLLSQTGGAAGIYLMRSLSRGIASAIDRAALVGSGANGDPLGIFGQANVTTVAFSGAATLAKVQSFQEQLALLDVDDQALAWIGSPAVRTKWRSIQKWTGASVSLWDCDADQVLARRALVSSHCSSTVGIVLGDWSQYKVAFWGNVIEIIVDRFSLSTSGRVRYVANALVDCGSARPALFCRASDSAVA